MSGVKLGKWHLSLAVVFLILGVLLSTSFYAQKKWDVTPGLRKTKLIEFIKSQDRQREKIEYDLQKLRAEVDGFQKRAATSEGEMGTFGKEIDALKKLAGLTKVSGEGVEVIISDAEDVPSNKDPNNYIVHDYDLQILVNALWQAGAEAISLNGQRFVSTTAIRCAGSTVMVNSEPLGSPYVIEAIGDRDDLIKVLDKDPDAKQLIQTYAKAFDMPVNISRFEELEIPAYEGSLRFDNVTVVVE